MKRNEVTKRRTEIGIGAGVLPEDRIDSKTGRIKKTAVPDKFMQGTFSNQVEEGPFRMPLVIDRTIKTQEE